MAQAFKDMRETYPVRIFEQFAKHETSPVRVEGVTQVDPDGSGPKLPRRLEIADMDATMEVPGNSAIGNAKRELLVILLNVMSGRLSLNLIVDGEGTEHALEPEASVEPACEAGCIVELETGEQYEMQGAETATIDGGILFIDSAPEIPEDQYPEVDVPDPDRRRPEPARGRGGLRSGHQ